MKKLVLLMIMVLFSVGIFATDYYIKPNGDDTKDGLSEANAWQHFHRVFVDDGYGHYLQAGDTLHVLAPQGNETFNYVSGDNAVFYAYGKSGEEGNPITIVADVERTPVLQGAGEKPVIWLYNCSYITIEGLTCKNARTDSSTGGEVVKLADCSDITLKRILATTPDDYGYFGGSYQFKNIQVYAMSNCSRLVIEECEAYNFGRIAFDLLGCPPQDDCSNPDNGCKVIRCYANMTGCPSPATGYLPIGFVAYNSAHTTFENCLVEETSYGLNMTSGDICPGVDYSNCCRKYSHDNAFYSCIAMNGRYGMTQQNCFDNTYKDCLIFADPTNYSSVGMYPRSSNVTLDHCTVYGHGYPGSTSPPICAQGIVADDIGNCSTMPFSCGITARNTLSFNNGGNGNSQIGSSGAYVVANTLYDRCNTYSAVGGSISNYYWNPYTCTYCSLCDNPNHTGEYFTCDDDLMNDNDTGDYSDIARYCLQNNEPDGMGMDHDETLLYVPECSNMHDFNNETGVNVGADVCWRYEDGTQTSDPVFEFPMDDPDEPAIMFPCGAVVSGINSSGNVASNVIRRLNAEGYDKMPYVAFYDSFDSDHECEDWTSCDANGWTWDDTNEEFDDSNATTTINWNEPDTAITGDVSFFQADVTPTNLLYGYNEIGMRAFYLSDAKGESYIQLSIYQGTGDCTHLLYFKRVVEGTVTEQEELADDICLNTTYRLRITSETVNSVDYWKVYMNGTEIYSLQQDNDPVGTGMKIGVAKAAATFDEVLIGR